MTLTISMSLEDWKVFTGVCIHKFAPDLVADLEMPQGVESRAFCLLDNICNVLDQAEEGGKK